MQVWLVAPETVRKPVEAVLGELLRAPTMAVAVAGITEQLTPDQSEKLNGIDAIVLVDDGKSGTEPLAEWLRPSRHLPPVLILSDSDGPARWESFLAHSTSALLPAGSDAQQIHETLISLIHAGRRERSLREEIVRCQQRLSDRVTIEKAKGLLQQRFGLTEEQAYRQLRLQSRRQRKQIREIAQSVLDASVLFEGNGEPNPAPRIHKA